MVISVRVREWVSEWVRAGEEEKRCICTGIGNDLVKNWIKLNKSQKVKQSDWLSKRKKKERVFFFLPKSSHSLRWAELSSGKHS